jgi:hypothetical protein
MHSWSVTVRIFSINISGCMAEFYDICRYLFIRQQSEQCHIPAHGFFESSVEFSMGTHQTILSLMKYCTKCKARKVIVFCWVPDLALRPHWAPCSCQGSHFVWRSNMNSDLRATLLYAVSSAWQNWLICKATNCCLCKDLCRSISPPLVESGGRRSWSHGFRLVTLDIILVAWTASTNVCFLWGTSYCSTSSHQMFIYEGVMLYLRSSQQCRTSLLMIIVACLMLWHLGIVLGSPRQFDYVMLF